MSTKLKKLMLVAVFALILAMALGINAFAERDQVGDLNRDGVKDENDAIYLLNHYIFGGDYEIDQPSDYNGDGKLTNDDVTSLKNAILGKSEGYATEVFIYDITGEGKVTALDLALINAAVKGKISIW